jgi:hypothetical protein
MEQARASASASRAPDRLSRRMAAIRLGGSGVAAALLAGRLVPVAAQEASPAAGTPEAERPYVVIRQYQFAPGHTMEDLIDAVTAGFLPIVREVPGFMQYDFVEIAGGVVTISVFRDQAGAEESTRRAADWITENLAGFYAGPPTVTTGNIWLHETDASATGTPVTP